MNKKVGLWIVLDLVLVIVFNVIFFMYGSETRTIAVWLSYIFIHIAYGMVIATPFLTRKGREYALFGITTFSISVVYFLMSLAFGIVVFILRPITFKWVIMINTFLTGAYAVILIINMLANEHSVDEIKRQELQIQYVRGCSARLLDLIEITSDKKLKKKLQKAYDVIHSSQIASNSGAQKYEMEVLVLLDDLEKNIEETNYEDGMQIVDSLIRAANRRNQEV